MNVIAVAGCMHRIGTTTQALQLINVLNSLNSKAVYLEANRNEYLDQVTAVYVNVKESKKFIQKDGIQMYKRNYALAAEHSGADYIVKDYGNMDSDHFEEASFAGEKTKIVVCGSKPQEIIKTQEMLANPAFDDSFYVFSLVPEIDRLGVLAFMAQNAQCIFFADVILDPFEVNASSSILYNKILNFKSE